MKGKETEEQLTFYCPGCGTKLDMTKPCKGVSITFFCRCCEMAIQLRYDEWNSDAFVELTIH